MPLAEWSQDFNQLSKVIGRQGHDHRFGREWLIDHSDPLMPTSRIDPLPPGKRHTQHHPPQEQHVNGNVNLFCGSAQRRNRVIDVQLQPKRSCLLVAICGSAGSTEQPLGCPGCYRGNPRKHEKTWVPPKTKHPPDEECALTKFLHIDRLALEGNAGGNACTIVWHFFWVQWH